MSMNTELVVFGVLAIGFLAIWAIVAQVVRESREERAEARSRERVRREYVDIRWKRPEHIVQVSEQIEKNTPRKDQ